VAAPVPATEADARPAGARVTVSYNQADTELVYPVRPGDRYAVVCRPDQPQYPWSVRVEHLTDTP
jgi:hypothetical protein